MKKDIQRIFIILLSGILINLILVMGVEQFLASDVFANLIQFTNVVFLITSSFIANKPKKRR